MFFVQCTQTLCLSYKLFSIEKTTVSFRIRAVGTAAVNMCLVATGGADAYYEMGIHCWDMAGAGIIITEAGGVLLDVSGKYTGMLFCPFT